MNYIYNIFGWVSNEIVSNKKLTFSVDDLKACKHNLKKTNTVSRRFFYPTKLELTEKYKQIKNNKYENENILSNRLVIANKDLINAKKNLKKNKYSCPLINEIQEKYKKMKNKDLLKNIRNAKNNLKKKSENIFILDFQEKRQQIKNKQFINNILTARKNLKNCNNEKKKQYNTFLDDFIQKRNDIMLK